MQLRAQPHSGDWQPPEGRREAPHLLLSPQREHGRQHLDFTFPLRDWERRVCCFKPPRWDTSVVVYAFVSVCVDVVLHVLVWCVSVCFRGDLAVLQSVLQSGLGGLCVLGCVCTHVFTC